VKIAISQNLFFILLSASMGKKKQKLHQKQPICAEILRKIPTMGRLLKKALHRFF
jgi:hypothetical protein